ncbi:hypothetical protein ACTXJR_00060 [Glutamicibacter ardleyensis]|uniref:hypothetical protein n=1 Tax=Glutamicibacter ardleyensis TaxID=225894 RepID=UPI003F9283FB
MRSVAANYWMPRFKFMERRATVQAGCRQAHVLTRSFYELYADKSVLCQALYRELNEQVLQGFAGFYVDPLASVRQSVPSMVITALGPIQSDERKIRVLEV